MSVENQETPSFSMGVASYRHRTNKKNKPILPIKKRMPLETNLVQYFPDSNPLYVKRLIKVYETHAVTFDPDYRTQPREITMLLSKKVDDTDIYSVALRSIRYFKGTFIEWQIYLQKRAMDARSMEIKSNFVFTNPSKICTSFNSNIPAIAQHIFWWNQRYRWIMKRAVGRFIGRKAASRIIGAESDIMTLDPIPIKDQIRIVCSASRTTYVFSGSTLLKTIISNLETQIEAIPRPRSPINPYTNLPFTYGQMIEVYHRLITWCGQTRRKIPAILSLYREAHFNPSIMYRMNHNYIQYTAGKNHFIRDESDNDYFLENLDEMINAYRLSNTAAAEERRMCVNFTKRFTNWIVRGTSTHLIRAWRQLVTDYWYYKQTEILPRTYWISEDTIIKDINTLLQASKSNIMYTQKTIVLSH